MGCLGFFSLFLFSFDSFFLHLVFYFYEYLSRITGHILAHLFSNFPSLSSLKEWDPFLENDVYDPFLYFFFFFFALFLNVFIHLVYFLCQYFFPSSVFFSLFLVCFDSLFTHLVYYFLCFHQGSQGIYWPILFSNFPCVSWNWVKNEILIWKMMSIIPFFVYFLFCFLMYSFIWFIVFVNMFIIITINIFFYSYPLTF